MVLSKSNSQYGLNAYYMPDTVLNTFIYYFVSHIKTMK